VQGGKWIYILPLRLRSLFRRQRVDRELDEELRFHVERKTERSIAKGMTPDEARRSALLEIGGLEKRKEECRQARRVNWIQDPIQDLRYGLRMLRKSPGFTAAAVLTLALGIGVNTAIFGMVNGFLLRPLAVPSPEQITVLAIQQRDAPVGSSGFSYPEFVDFRKQADTFSSVFAIVLGTVRLTVDDRSEECFANYVSQGFFFDLGLTPAAGRLLLPTEGEVKGEPLLAVLGYSYWQRKFRGDPRVVGKQIRLDGKSATIIGVAPRRFPGMHSIFEVDLYLPLSAFSMDERADRFWTSRDGRGMLAFGRLKPGLSLGQAQGSLDVVTARLAIQYPATDKWFTVQAVPEKLARPIPYANNGFVAIAGLFLTLAAFVLLLACMNVENMLLARGSVRQREVAIRAALGAGRGRLICQMLTESVLLAVLGGAAGMFLGVWVCHLTSAIHLRNIPLHLDSTFDWRVFTFASACALFTGILVGLWPALRASSADLNSVLHEGGRRDVYGLQHTGFRNLLVIAQVAGSLVLLVAAGLFVRSLQKVQGFDLGFDPDRLLNVIVDPHEAGYDEARTTQFYREIERNVRALPGVESVSLASYVPMGGYPSKAPVSIEGHPTPPGQQAPRVLLNRIDPPYFETMGIPLLRGRVFEESDNHTSPPVAIVNQTMANHFWPSGDAIGKRFSMNGDSGPFLEVVGVVGNGKYQTLNEDAQPFFYLPIAQDFVSKRALQIRTRVSPASVAGPVKEQIARLGPDLSLIDIETMKQSLEGAFGFFTYRVAAIFAGALGGTGLIVAIVGVYGVVSFTASQRTREIGIRMALGANSRDILALVWKHGLRLVIAGVVVGAIAASALARTMGGLLAGVRPSDPATYITVAMLLSVVGLVACWIPARRAMRVDPMFAVRHE
jgi:predicted permease